MLASVLPELFSDCAMFSLDFLFPIWEHVDVRLVSARRIREFEDLHSDAAGPLAHWANVVKASSWQNPAQLRAAFGAVDFVGELTVFDIAGNKYRLIAYIHYRQQIVYIKHILTHKEYDKGAWKRRRVSQ